MPNSDVYEVGRLQPEDEYTITVGVDFGEVSLRFGGSTVTLNATEFEELSHLLVQASWQAAADSERLKAEAEDE